MLRILSALLFCGAARCIFMAGQSPPNADLPPVRCPPSCVRQFGRMLYHQFFYPGKWPPPLYPPSCPLRTFPRFSCTRRVHCSQLPQRVGKTVGKKNTSVLKRSPLVNTPLAAPPPNAPVRLRLPRGAIPSTAVRTPASCREGPNKGNAHIIYGFLKHIQKWPDSFF